MLKVKQNFIKSKNKKILISNGYKDFHLISAAKVLLTNKTKLILYSGFFLNNFFEYLIKFFKINNHKINKLILRRQGIKSKYLKTFFLGEFLHEIGIIFKNKFNLKKLSDNVIIYCYRLYANKLEKYIVKNKLNINIYHFRSGYGGRSVKTAKSLGIKTICDHSTAHPSMFNYLIKNGGKFPNKKIKPPKDFWKLVLQDLVDADFILVNSNFVKKTLVYMNIPFNKIHVIYTGLENKYFKLLKKKNFFQINKSKIKFLFVGGVNKGKGFDEIVSAINLLIKNNRNFEFHVVGSLTKEFNVKYISFLKKSSIKFHGIKNYKEVMDIMYKSDVFVFPSNVEGSARVIFEAMASGCPIITTKNSGSIVKNKENGFIVDSGDYKSVYSAMLKFINNPGLISLYGKKNEKIIRQEYHPKKYAEKLIKYYKST
jgi:glycosyltransferase involved in cell wall biosynthesis